MTKLNLNLSVYTKKLGAGRWLAATGVAPYFCVEGTTKAAALNLAREALLFFVESNDSSGRSVESLARKRGIASLAKKHQRERGPIPTFDRNDKVSAKELVAVGSQDRHNVVDASAINME
jgi:hypothetical protein